MDTKFQTSFIPKKPILADQNVIKRHSGGTSVFMFISVIIFILSLVGAGSTFVFKDALLKYQSDYRLQLKNKAASFDEPLIEKLKKANIKIDLATQLLKKHLAVSSLFDILSLLTIQGVRFTSFEFSSPDANASGNKSTDSLKVVMRGVGNNFSSIAFQSDVFGQSEKYGKYKALKNPVLSDLVLDSNGNVEFTFTAYISTADIPYEQTLTAQ